MQLSCIGSEGPGVTEIISVLTIVNLEEKKVNEYVHKLFYGCYDQYKEEVMWKSKVGHLTGWDEGEQRQKLPSHREKSLKTSRNWHNVGCFKALILGILHEKMD